MTPYRQVFKKKKKQTGYWKMRKKEVKFLEEYKQMLELKNT